MYIIDFKKFAVRKNKFATNSIAYWFKSMIYDLFENEYLCLIKNLFHALQKNTRKCVNVIV